MRLYDIENVIVWSLVMPRTPRDRADTMGAPPAPPGRYRRVDQYIRWIWAYTPFKNARAYILQKKTHQNGFARIRRPELRFRCPDPFLMPTHRERSN